MKGTMQLRVRLLPAAAARLKGFTPRQRAAVVAALIEGVYADVDLPRLLTYQGDLRRLAANLNQWLRIHYSTGRKVAEADMDAVRGIVALMDRLCGKAPR